MISRRRFMSAAVLGMAAAQGWSRDGLIRGALASSEANPIADDRVSETVLSIHSRTTLIEPPPGAKAVRLWIPVPPNGPGQTVNGLSVTCAHPHRIETEPVYGNQMVHVESRDQRKGFDVDVRYEASLRRLGRTPGPGNAADLAPHLKLAGLEEMSPAIESFGRKVVGTERDPVRAARLLYDALIDLLTYDKAIPGCGMGNSAWTFDNKRGRCDDFHALYRTLLISRGIPTRWEQGLALPYPSQMSKSGELEGDCTGAHCWVSVHANGEWIPVDVSEAWKRRDLRDFYFGNLVANHLQVSVGRDLVLAPPQGGDPLGSFPLPYGESDEGIPMVYGKTYRTKVTFKVLRVV
jgi:transglutaminase-like putative cysteine protease